MCAIALVFHDVADGPANRYTVTPQRFRAQLDALADADVVLTFDDGDRSNATVAAPELERRGLLGHFFPITERIGRAGSLAGDEVRALRAAGHTVGSHSHTHRWLNRLARAEVDEEWRASKAILEEILGEPVTAASVPRGGWNGTVVESAVAAGYRTIFLSEPWTRPRARAGAELHGRFAVIADTPPERLAALARLDPRALLREQVVWQTKQVAKGALGPAYTRFRDRLLERRHTPA